MRVLVHLVRRHRPELPGMLVGNGDDDLAERHSAIQRAYPSLLGCGLFRRDGLGPLQTTAGALD